MCNIPCGFYNISKWAKLDVWTINFPPIWSHLYVSSKVVAEFYIKWYENGYIGSILLRCAMCIIQAWNDQNTLIVQSIPEISWGESGDHHCQAHLIRYFDQNQTSLINTRDSIQNNPGQTLVLYKKDQTHLTSTKRDPDGPTPVSTMMWITPSTNMNVSCFNPNHKFTG